jgi:hypothetical protein
MTLLTLAMPEQLGHGGGRSSGYPLRATHTTTEYIIKDGHKQFSKPIHFYSCALLITFNRGGAHARLYNSIKKTKKGC